MSAIVMGVTFYKFVMKRNYLSPPTSSQTMPNFLLMASIIQVSYLTFFTNVLIMISNIWSVESRFVGNGELMGNIHLNLITCDKLQIVTPCPITSAIEMGLCVEIFSMFLVCHSWTVLKPYD